MKNFLIVAALLAVLPACSLFQPAQIPVKQSLPVAAQETQKIINEANVLLTAAANVIAQNIQSGVLAKEDALPQIKRLAELAKQVDSVQLLLDSGNILTAKNQAELLSLAILTLHKQIVSRKVKT